MGLKSFWRGRLESIDMKDILIETFNTPSVGLMVGLGNTTVKLTHVPTGLSVTSSDQNTHHKNKEKAFGFLKIALSALNNNLYNRGCKP